MIYVQVTPMAGMHLFDLLTDAIALAQTLQCGVEATFHDHLVRVSPLDTVEHAYRWYVQTWREWSPSEEAELQHMLHMEDHAAPHGR